jgi:hypothetical protein
MLVIFFWILFTALVVAGAYSRNRSVIGWTIGSFFISPFIALLFILVLGKIEKTSEPQTRTINVEAPSWM